MPSVVLLLWPVLIKSAMRLGWRKLTNIQPTFDQHLANMLARRWMKLLLPFAVFANISPTCWQDVGQMLVECWLICASLKLAQ